MITHHHYHRVRYRECDRMGVVYHVNVLDHFEAARTELLRDNGITYKNLEDSGVLIQVVEVNVRYHKPLFYDDELDIKIVADKRPTLTIELHNEIRRQGEDDLLVSGRVRLCFVDRESGRPIRPPQAFLEALYPQS